MKTSTSHPFFQNIQIEELNLETFDSKLESAHDELVGIFFWGHDCPNCEVAKTMLNLDAGKFGSFGLKWFHVNTYENFDLGTRFGLFGIPTFLFFYKGKKLGRITPFPGTAPFFEALEDLQKRVINTPPPQG